jgi:DNA-directed RNA polymerase I, II, and III subunit RPABC5
MIIPVRCVSCSKILGDKWEYYCEQIKEYEENEAKEDKAGTKKTTTKDTHKSFAPAFRGAILDKMGITRICCRRHMLGHVDIDI